MGKQTYSSLLLLKSTIAKNNFFRVRINLEDISLKAEYVLDSMCPI